MKNTLYIKLEDSFEKYMNRPEIGPCYFDEFEKLKEKYIHIVDQTGYRYVTKEERNEMLISAIDIIIAAMITDRLYAIEVDLDKHGMKYREPVEMTMEDIERELGHPVKIVKKG